MTGDTVPSRSARSISYQHDGDKYEVTVGKPRKHYPCKTGPRGGYLKDAGWQGWGSETGSNVVSITATEQVIEVHSEEPSLGWASPSLVGRDEVISIEWAQEPDTAEESAE